MKNIVDKILFKIYIQDVSGFIKRKLKFNQKERVVKSFLDECSDLSVSKDGILSLAIRHFQSQGTKFYDVCFGLVERILQEPLIDDLKFNVEHLNYQDIPHLIRIADSFGRFDCGYLLRNEYCQMLEKGALGLNSSRREKILYLFHKQLFGDVFFHSNDLDVAVHIPFYLRRIHKKFMSNCDSEPGSNDLDNEFSRRIHNKTIALLAPGILAFDVPLIQELNEFDEIIPITFTTNHYKDFPLPIRISYYNKYNSLKLMNDDRFRDGINLEIYCLKNKVTAHPKYREIMKDSFKWVLGSPNMVQAAVFDLLCQSPKKIKIYGMNFFLSAQPHHRDYQTNLSLRSLAFHNVVSNFAYIQALHRRGNIDLDTEAKRLIDAGLINYTIEMSKRYSLYQ